MKSQFRNVIKKIAKNFPFRLFPYGKYPAVIGLYHAVESVQPAYIGTYKVKTPSEFEDDLDFLLRFFRPISLAELLENKINKPAVHLTFDDGLKSCSEIIAPILKKKGIPATFFINPDFIGNHKMLHNFIYDILVQKGLQPDPILRYKSHYEHLCQFLYEHNIDIKDLIQSYTPYMDFRDLQLLKNESFLIGGHSMSHPEFYKIRQKEQLNQVFESMQWVVSHFNPEVRAFAFPYTDDGINNKLLQKIHQSDLVDVTMGTAGLKYDIFPDHFQRIPMEWNKYAHAKDILKYEYFYFRLKSIFKKNTVLRDD